MFNTIMHSLIGFTQAKLRYTVIAGAVLAGLPTAAFAHHHGFSIDLVVPAPEVIVSPDRCEPAPATQIWVAPVYRTCTDRVWVEPVTTTQVQRVEIPAQYAWRDVVFHDGWNRGHVLRKQVEVCPARCEDRTVQVVVCPGHFEQQTHQELIAAGHWETVVRERPVIVEREQPRLEIRLPF